MLSADTNPMQTQLDVISGHARLLLPPPKSPELNPDEHNRHHLRQTRLSKWLCEGYTGICNACCEASNKLIAEPGRIASIGTRAQTFTGQHQ